MRRPLMHVCWQLLERVNACNALGDQQWFPLVVDRSAVGSVTATDADLLCAIDDVFQMDLDEGVLRFAQAFEQADAAIRTSAVARVTDALRKRGVVRGWRDELVPVSGRFGAEPKFLVERAAYPMLGVAGYGVHVNGFVRDGDSIQLWVGRRARSKQTWPGMLDHLVAGHLSHGLTPSETVIKEAGEEAGIAPNLASGAVSSGAVSYRGVDEDGRLKNDCLFCFDLELPASFDPIPVDGEVEEFYLWDLDTVVEKIVACEFKPNVVLVIVDFLLRHGHLSPDLAGYLDLAGSLRQGDCR